jgi:hypothetical protein
MIAKINRDSAVIEKSIDSIKQKIAIHRVKYTKERSEMERKVEALIRKRKSVELKFISEISARIDKGESISSIAKEFNVTAPAVSNWKKHYEKLKP